MECFVHFRFCSYSESVAVLLENVALLPFKMLSIFLKHLCIWGKLNYWELTEEGLPNELLCVSI